MDGIEKNRGPYFLDPDDCLIVGVDIEAGPEHPLYDVRVLLPIEATDVESVLRWGVKVPIEVVRDGSRYLVAEGRQRVRWAREANARTGAGRDDIRRVRVRAIVTRDTADNLALWGVASNEHRRDTPPYLKAQQAKYLADRGASPEQIAAEFGCSPAAVKSWLRLLDLPPEVQAAVCDGRIAAHTALQMHGRAGEEQNAILLPAGRGEPVKRGRGRPPGSRTRPLGERIRPSRPTAVALRRLAKLTTDEILGTALLFAAGDLSSEECRARLPRHWPVIERGGD